MVEAKEKLAARGNGELTYSSADMRSVQRRTLTSTVIGNDAETPPADSGYLPSLLPAARSERIV